MVKFKREDLLEVLPTAILESKELTTKQKTVLGQLIIYNGLEQTKHNGFFYRSNKDLMNDCNITEMTLLTAIRKLNDMGFIERKQGKRGVGASEYRINENTINDYYKNNNENYSNNYSNQIEDILLKINELTNTIKKLEDKIIVLNYSNNYSTDTESDIDTEIEKEEENNNIYNIPVNLITSSKPLETPMGTATTITTSTTTAMSISNTITSSNTTTIEMSDTNFEKNFNVLLERMNNTNSIEELDEKRNKFNKWLKERTNTQSWYSTVYKRYLEIKERLSPQTPIDGSVDGENNETSMESNGAEPTEPSNDEGGQVPRSEGENVSEGSTVTESDSVFGNTNDVDNYQGEVEKPYIHTQLETFTYLGDGEFNGKSVNVYEAKEHNLKYYMLKKSNGTFMTKDEYNKYLRMSQRVIPAYEFKEI